jgi:hypothetical protein
MSDFRFLAVITTTAVQGPIARRIEPYHYDRAIKLEAGPVTGLALNAGELPQLRAMAEGGPLTCAHARALAAKGGACLDVMPPLVCVVCSEDLDEGDVAYGDCVGCGWMVCEGCDASVLPGSGQSVCLASECRAHPDAAVADHAP